MKSFTGADRSLAEATAGRHCVALYLLLFFLIIQVLLWWSAWAKFLSSDEIYIVKHREEFRNGVARAEIELSGDWLYKDEALWLAPGVNGKLKLQLNTEPGQKVYLRLWMQGAPEIENTIYASDTQTEFFNISDKTWRGDVFSLDTNSIDSSTSIVVFMISATHPGGNSASPLPVIERLEWGYNTPAASNIPPFPGMLAVAILAAYLWVVAPPRKLERIILAVLIPSAAAIFLRMGRAPSMYMIVMVVLLIEVIFRVLPMGRALSLPRWPALYTLSGILLIAGAQARWEKLIEFAGYNLDPDAQGFFSIITTMTSPYDTATSIAPYVREPLFAWIGKLWFWLTPDTITSFRTFTVLLSIALLAASFETGRRLFGAFIGFAVLLFMAFNEFLIFNAPRGLRLEFYTLLSLWMVCSFLLIWGEQNNRGEAKAPCGRFKRFGFALVASLSCLVRITSLAYVLPMLVVLALRRKFSIKEIMLVLVVIIGPLLPHLIFNYHFDESSDPLYSSSIHARYYRNIEFEDQPGFLTSEQVSTDPYGGPPITTFGYVFGMHNPIEWVVLPIKGFLKLFIYNFSYKTAFQYNKVVWGLYLISLMIVFIFKSNWPLGIGLLLLSLPVVFVYGIINISPRLIGHYLPFIYMILGLGLLIIRDWCINHLD